MRVPTLAPVRMELRLRMQPRAWVMQRWLTACAMLFGLIWSIWLCGLLLLHGFCCGGRRLEGLLGRLLVLLRRCEFGLTDD